MRRRTILLALPLLSAGLLRTRLDARRQPVEPSFLRTWLAAQQRQPARLTSRARIAPADEPGEPLVVHGQVFEADGVRPAAGQVIFAYHTDRDGHYDRPGRDGWRLTGWARTGADGRFVFTTIRPGAYPGRQVAAHVHVGIDGPRGQRRLLRDVLFEADPKLTAAEIAAARRDGAFGNVRPVRVVDGVQLVEMRFRLPGEFVF